MKIQLELHGGLAGTVRYAELEVGTPDSPIGGSELAPLLAAADEAEEGPPAATADSMSYALRMTLDDGTERELRIPHSDEPSRAELMEVLERIRMYSKPL